MEYNKIFQNVPLLLFFFISAFRGRRQWHYKENVTSTASHATLILDARGYAELVAQIELEDKASICKILLV